MNSMESEERKKTKESTFEFDLNRQADEVLNPTHGSSFILRNYHSQLTKQRRTKDTKTEIKK